MSIELILGEIHNALGRCVVCGETSPANAAESQWSMMLVLHTGPTSYGNPSANKATNVAVCPVCFDLMALRIQEVQERPGLTREQLHGQT